MFFALFVPYSVQAERTTVFSASFKDNSTGYSSVAQAGNAAMMATALFPVLVFVIGTAVASVSPAVAQFTWCLGFLAPFAGWLAGRRER